MASRIVVGVASIHRRSDNLFRVVRDLAPHVNEIHVYLNDYPARPEWWFDRSIRGAEVHYHLAPMGDIGDAGKFAFAGSIPTSHYYLAVDDDLIYPPSYVPRTIGAIERYYRKYAVSWHGKRLNLETRPWKRFWSDSFEYQVRCLNTQPEDVMVHLPGTGVFGYHSSTFQVRPFNRAPANMADIHVGEQLAKARVGCVALAHTQGWIQHQEIDLSDTIWAKMARTDQTDQTRIVNRVTWPELPWSPTTP